MNARHGVVAAVAVLAVLGATVAAPGTHGKCGPLRLAFTDRLVALNPIDLYERRFRSGVAALVPRTRTGRL